MYIMKITIVPNVYITGMTKNYGELDDAGNKGKGKVRTFPLMTETPITLTIKNNPAFVRFNNVMNGYEKITEKERLAIERGAIQSGVRVVYGLNNKIIGWDSGGGAGNFSTDIGELFQFFPTDNRERLYIIREIKKQLKDIIKDRVQTAFNNDIGIFMDDGQSPPIVLDEPDSWNGDEEFQEGYIKNNVKATFQIVQDTEYLDRIPFGQERVFKLHAPVLNGITTFYQHKDKSLTCGYDYIVNTYGKRNGFKKVAGDKYLVDKAIHKPTEEAKLIYEEWKKLYWDEFHNAGSKVDIIHTLPSYISVSEIEDDDWYKIKGVKFMDRWLKKNEKELTLCVLDLVKWCIMAKVRLNVMDHDNSYYLNYNPDQFRDRYRRSKFNNHNISLVVKYSHAYFIEDPLIKLSLSLRDTLHKLDLETPVKKGKETNQKEETTEVEIDYIINARDDEWNGNWKDTPPPTIEKLIELSKSEDRTHYYIDTPNVNGLVNILYKSYDIPPTCLSGSIQSIHTASYGLLKVYSRHKSPPRVDKLKDNREQVEQTYTKLWEKYPKLRTNWGKLATATSIGEAVYEDLKLEDHTSMFNTALRKIFYNNEIKPDNRNKSSNGTPVFSIDFKRAYTTAIMNNEYRYNIYDAVSQVGKFNGNFQPHLFYLCYNKCEGFPLKEGNGLLLYHGSLLRLIRDKVDIKYVVNPIRTLSPNHFVPFVDKVNELEEEGVFKDITKSKEVVNCFVGNLKRKDGITDYKLWLIDNKHTAMREMLKGRMPCKLVDTANYTKETMLVGKPKHVYHFHSAQPIRLQIMEQVNEQLYLLYLHYKTCLHTYKFVSIFQNDIKQRRSVAKLRGKKIIGKINRKIDFTPNLVGVKTDALYLQSPIKCEEFTKKRRTPFGTTVETKEWDTNSVGVWDNFIGYIYKTWNELSDWKVLPESKLTTWDWGKACKEYSKQIGVKYIPNEWNTDIDITYKWDKDIGGKILINHLIVSGGGWVNGLGGRGKSELIVSLDNIIKRNRIRYKWMRGIYKTLCPDKYFDKLEEWRDKNPCSYRKFAPTNKASNRIDGKTLHKGLGIPVFGDKKDEVGEEDILQDPEVSSGVYLESVLRKLEGNPADKKHACNIIVVDEISMVNGRMWSYLAYIKLRCPTIKFILCGDIDHQLKPIGEERRNFGHAYVIKELCEFNRLTLHYNFRTGQTTDQLWELCKSPSYFRNRTGEDTDRNLCYTHKKRKEVVDYFQDKIVNPIVLIPPETDRKKDEHNETFKFTYGTPVIARISNADLDICKNELYYIVGIGDSISLWEPDRKKKVIIPRDDIMRMVLSGYCLTIHKSQSETYRDKYTIHEWDKLSNVIDNNFQRLRYTALSRSSCWEDNVFIKS